MIRQAVGAVVLVGASALLAPRSTSGQGHTSACIWTTQSNSALPECIEYSQDCQGCCLHEHGALNWDSCIINGDYEKGSVTIKYFQTQMRACTEVGEVFVCQDAGGPGPCAHYKRDCSIVECED